MKIGGDLAFWVKAAGVAVGLYLLWRVYEGAKQVADEVGGIVSAPGRAAKAVGGAIGGAAKATGGVVGGAFSRPASVEEGEGASAPGYGP